MAANSEKCGLSRSEFQVQIRLGPLTPGLRRYAKKLDVDFKGAWKSGPRVSFEYDLNRANVVLSGDFHAYAQSQRAHIRMLRDLIDAKPVVLALECLKPEHDKLAAQVIAQAKFPKRVFARNRMGKELGLYLWENYRPLFELARNQQLIVRGLNGKANSSL